MHGNSGLAFEYGFDSDSTSSYLVLNFTNDYKLLNHQVEIICQNPNPAFVPFHMRREDEKTSIYYNITSKISLSQYLERKTLSKKELLDLLRNITKNLMQHCNYLLDLSGFVIDLDFIYINPATTEVSLIYIPTPCNRDTMKVYSTFLKDLAVNSANVDDSAKDNYLQRILSYLKSDSFSLSDFNRLIVDLRNNGGLYDSAAKSDYEYREGAVSEGIAASGNNIIIRKPEKGANKGAGGNRKILSIVFLQLLIIMASTIVCLLMMSKSMGDMASMAGVLLIAVALDILAMKRIASKQANQTTMDDGRQESINDFHHLEQVQGKRAVSCHDTVQKLDRSSSKRRHQTTFREPEVLNACDTIMISEVPKESHPYLESVGARIVERIIINKDKFIIGRLGSMVDHIIQGSTVGKLHAEITSNEGSYYLKDLNSKNGTYINGLKITSNKECEIKGNDRIRFSNFEYIFRQ